MSKKYPYPKNSREANKIVDQWHSGKIKTKQLYTAMGMTWSQYKRWVEKNILPKSIK